MTGTGAETGEAVVVLHTTSPEETRAVGVTLARALRAGDLVVLSGPLGAGKTVLTQGIAAGLEVRGAVTSPTFVLARVHRARHPGAPGLVHVDAYRLRDRPDAALALDDLDLDADLEAAVVVVEWGEGLAARLSPSRVEVDLTRLADDRRRVGVRPVGPAWQDRPLALPTG